MLLSLVIESCFIDIKVLRLYWSSFSHPFNFVSLSSNSKFFNCLVISFLSLVVELFISEGK